MRRGEVSKEVIYVMLGIKEDGSGICYSEGVK